MSNRTEVDNRVLIDGRPYKLKLIENPTIDDVVITEANLQAYIVENGDIGDRRVDRSLREFLVRIGVER